MELLDFRDKLMSICDTNSIDDLKNKLMDIVLNNDTKKYELYCDIVKNDLSVDQLQKVYQYYHADRNNLKQDYTPKTLAKLVSRLVQNDNVIDMCCGSGTLTIQRWCVKPDTKFTLYEFDENVIPYLLFNLAVRNINAKVYHMDVLSQQVFNVYDVESQKKFSKVVKIK